MACNQGIYWKESRLNKNQTESADFANIVSWAENEHIAKF